ncbi:MAG: hypothetical protein N6V41_01615, partial [Candidatus Portiera aleyrodidarum]|nr:hypothetical protein [Candidatus Portiera aleyrodidarum]
SEQFKQQYYPITTKLKTNTTNHPSTTTTTTTTTWQTALDLDEQQKHQYEAEQAARWLVSNSKCHIPVLKPW